MDLLSKSDPFAVVLLRTASGGWEEVARTETIQDNLDPHWTTQIQMDYHFEEVQTIKVAVYDEDSPSRDLRRHDFIGESQPLSLASLVSAPGGSSAEPLRRSGRKAGVVIINVEEVSGSNDELLMTWAGHKLDKKDFFGKSDPFVELARTTEDGRRVVVWRSDVIKVNLNPRWKQASVPLQKLCNGDVYRPLVVSVWDWNSNGSHDLIGEGQMSVSDMLAANGGTLELINPAKARKRRYKNSGTLTVQAAVQQRPSLLDYIRGGMEINLVVAVDFTASNGDPNQPGTLHHGANNAYEQAIMSVGSVLEEYDHDGLIPAYGFGGRLDSGVDHCFPLNLSSVPECHGMAGVLEAYRGAIRRVRLSGPTIFSRVLNASMMFAARPQTQQEQHYTVLLIITDGVITDMRQTIDHLVEASTMPLSVVIVGVGNADFEAMEVLDADDEPLRSSNGYSQARDAVQFVEFNRFKHSPSRLAKETLAELPGQVLDYFKMQNLAPNPPRAADVERNVARELEEIRQATQAAQAAVPAAVLSAGAAAAASGGGGRLWRKVNPRDVVRQAQPVPVAPSRGNQLWGVARQRRNELPVAQALPMAAPAGASAPPLPPANSNWGRVDVARVAQLRNVGRDLLRQASAENLPVARPL